MMIDDVHEFWRRIFHFSAQPAIVLGQNHPLAVELLHVMVPRERPQLASERLKRIMS